MPSKRAKEAWIRLDLRLFDPRKAAEARLRMDNHSFSTRRSPHGMVCQLCRVKAATYQITERSSTDRFGEAHYCFKCYEAKYLKPPPGQRLPQA